MGNPASCCHPRNLYICSSHSYDHIGAPQGTIFVSLNGTRIGSCPNIYLGQETFDELREWHLTAGVWRGDREIPAAYAFLDPTSGALVPSACEKQYVLDTDGMDIGIQEL